MLLWRFFKTGMQNTMKCEIYMIQLIRLGYTLCISHVMKSIYHEMLYTTHERILYVWNLFVLYSWASTVQNKALSNKNTGHLGSIGVYSRHI